MNGDSFWRVCPKCQGKWESFGKWKAEVAFERYEDRTLSYLLSEDKQLRRYTHKFRVEEVRHIHCGGGMFDEGTDVSTEMVEV